MYNVYVWYYDISLVGESATQEAVGESEKVPVENSELSTDAAGSSDQPQQALSLICDE